LDPATLNASIMDVDSVSKIASMMPKATGKTTLG
jgi:hypothetical protein